MGKCHVISAKRMGWEKTYDYFIFPIEQYSEKDAMNQFQRVGKQTLKRNGQWYPYIAYEYNGTLYHSIIYSGIVDESDFL